MAVRPAPVASCSGGDHTHTAFPFCTLASFELAGAAACLQPLKPSQGAQGGVQPAGHSPARCSSPARTCCVCPVQQMLTQPCRASWAPPALKTKSLPSQKALQHPHQRNTPCEENLSEILQPGSVPRHAFVRFRLDSVGEMARRSHPGTELLGRNPEGAGKDPGPPRLPASRCTPAILLTKLRRFSRTSAGCDLPCRRCRWNLVPDQTEPDKAFPVCFASLAACHQTRQPKEAGVLQEKQCVIS